MSFGGPIDSMINQHKSNVRMLKGRKKLKEIQEGFKSQKRPPLQFGGGTEEEYARFKVRLGKEKRRDQNRFILILGLTLIIVMIILYWVITADYSGVIDVIE